MKPDLKTHKVGMASTGSCQLRGRGSGKKTFELYPLLPFHPRCKLNIDQHLASPYEVFPGTLTGRATSDYGLGKRQTRNEVFIAAANRNPRFLEMVVETWGIGSQGARKINFLFLSSLAWPEWSTFLKKQARQDSEASFPVFRVNYLLGAEFSALRAKLSEPSCVWQQLCCVVSGLLVFSLVSRLKMDGQQ